MIDDALFKQKLLAMRSALEAIEQTAKAGTETVELDQTRVGRLSRMDALQQQAMAKEAERRRTHQLRQITIALQRIDDGEFGYCLECAEEISSERLLLNPIVQHCIDCAERLEAQ